MQRAHALLRIGQRRFEAAAGRLAKTQKVPVPQQLIGGISGKIAPAGAAGA